VSAGIDHCRHTAASIAREERSRQNPIDVADILPIDKAVELLTELIVKSGAKPKSPSKR